MLIALIGNPNSGKTTLFNELTGANRTVGNWSGVTVDVEAGQCSFGQQTWQIADLPGIYSLTTAAPEQAVVESFLRCEKVDVILNVVNSTNLQRQLFLSTQLLELGIPMVIALNMSDELQSQGMELDEERLAELLDTPCIKISAAKGQGIEQLLSALSSRIESSTSPQMHRDYGDLSETEDAPNRYEKVEQLVSSCLQYQRNNLPGIHRLDQILCHPLWGIPIFILLLLSVFWLSFGTPAQFLSNGLASFCELHIKPGLAIFLYRLGIGSILRGLLVEGAFSGVSSILVFLPQLMILFLCLAILESSGYMARAAFISDKALSRFGLNGLSAIPLLLGCGCSVPGMIACRMIDDPQQRRLTMLSLPFMSCSARMPVYGLLISSFFPRQAWLWISGLYLLGLSFALLQAGFSKSGKRQKPAIWLLELPPYRPPRWRAVRRTVAVRCWDFISRAGTAVLAASLLMWLLSHFNSRLLPAAEMSDSFLAQLGYCLAPVLSPWGCGYWQIAVAICSGIMAKESIVAALAVTGLQGSALTQLLTKPAAAALLVFVLLYTPCVATLATARRESGSLAFAICMALRHLALAWLAAYLVYNCCCILGL